MPALPPAPKILRNDWFFTVGLDAFAKCRLFIFYTGVAPSAANLASLCGQIQFEWTAGNNYHQWFGTDVTLNSVAFTDLSSPTSAFDQLNINVAGNRGNRDIPASACVLVSQQIARRFRGGHNRIYWPAGIGGDLTNEQTWDATILAGVDDFMDNLINDLNTVIWAGGGTLGYAAVSYYQGFTVHLGTTGRARNVSTVRLAPVIDAVVDSVPRAGVAIQRRRQLGLA